MKITSAIIISLAFMTTAFASEIKPEKTDFEFYDRAITADARAELVGRWYGEKAQDDQSIKKWVVTRQDDGTYELKYKIIAKDGTMEIGVEFGIWGVRLPIYFTAMRGYLENGEMVDADTTDASLYDAYKITMVDKNSFTYHSYTSGNQFTVKKVDNDFEL